MAINMSHGKPNVIAAVSVNLVVAVANALVGLAVMALMARNLEVAQFGRVILLLTTINGFAIFEGLRPVIIHRIAANRDNPPSLFRSSTNINTLMAVFTISLIIVYFFLNSQEELSNISALLLVLTVIFFFFSIQFWIFLDAENDVMFTGITRSGCFIFLYFCFYSISFLKFNINYYIFAALIMHVLLLAIFIARFFYLNLNLKYFSRETEAFKESLLVPALNNIVFNMCAVTINVADRAIISATLGARMAGFYGGPSELTLRAVGLIRTGMQVIFPWFARLNTHSQQKIWFQSIMVVALVCGSGSAFLMLLREPIIVFLLGPSFEPAGDLLGLFGVGIMISTLGYVCILSLNANGNFYTQRRLYLAGAAALVTGATWGAFQGSLELVAVAFLVARSVDLILLIKILRGCEKSEKIWFTAISLTIFFAIAFAWKMHVAWSAMMLGISYILGYMQWRNNVALFR